MSVRLRVGMILDDPAAGWGADGGCQSKSRFLPGGDVTGQWPRELFSGLGCDGLGGILRVAGVGLLERAVDTCGVSCSAH